MSEALVDEKQTPSHQNAKKSYRILPNSSIKSSSEARPVAFSSPPINRPQHKEAQDDDAVGPAMSDLVRVIAKDYINTPKDRKKEDLFSDKSNVCRTPVQPQLRDVGDLLGVICQTPDLSDVISSADQESALEALVASIAKLTRPEQTELRKKNSGGIAAQVSFDGDDSSYSTDDISEEDDDDGMRDELRTLGKAVQDIREDMAKAQVEGISFFDEFTAAASEVPAKRAVYMPHMTTSDFLLVILMVVFVYLCYSIMSFYVKFQAVHITY